MSDRISVDAGLSAFPPNTSAAASNLTETKYHQSYVKVNQNSDLNNVSALSFLFKLKNYLTSDHYNEKVL